MNASVHKDLIRLGDAFRRTREEKGLSLREVESAISIRVHCLEAIESGCLGKLISPVYARGFIKKYASFLGLDGEQMLRDHPYVLKLLDEFTSKDAELVFELGFGSRSTPGRDVKWLPGAAKIALSVIGAAILWWFISIISSD
ncbi:helix-turn-helix domain-containing protein [Chlamydiifrater phoenicopteri]|uniref:helix-turn-helix domain-containing protein n=1 Tax=Chlamydiifrater phoenicopteri TaxID=2681469 RepID=UPI001BCB987D|nr:helix-turn-helix domain-containing protein [Chlamydiifrater phoenicopteri]